jgi:hypothetical protein
VGDAEVCARNLRLLVRDSGKSRQEVADEAEIEYKVLCRWLKHGVQRPTTALKKLCKWLGIQPYTLWHEQPDSREWPDLLHALMQIIGKHDRSWHLVNDLLKDLNRRYSIAEAADRLAREHPDLMPQEFQDKPYLAHESPFVAFAAIADQWDFDTSQEYYERLVSHLSAKKVVEDPVKDAVINEVKRQFSDWARVEIRTKVEEQVSKQMASAKPKDAATELAEILDKLSDHPEWSRFAAGDSDAAERQIAEQWAKAKESGIPADTFVHVSTRDILDGLKD